MSLISAATRARHCAAPIARSTKRSVKIYTRTGDKGKSSLFNGQRMEKDSATFSALGAVDELSANVGMAREFCIDAGNPLASKLALIQHHLFDVGAHVATPRAASEDAKLARTAFDEKRVELLEEWIDKLSGDLPPLTAFILPSGGKSSASLHLARTVCRRTEREIVPLVRAGEVDSEVGRYVNRLSDLLFMAARAAAKHDGREETLWKPNATEDTA
eukprot:CAMPEP_0114558968 /NCGR_PEP_ID=MMETSP0114-20121206/10674_1 /TAXON_ID=31324 /ORGANISM="Goniomonas sp, Strain m" /LENGTH=216 /DNA_ID=CAMNT_0001744413 /DNA_START=16 /DNA_END=666 /DNA_ORIENTATION=+